MTIKDIAEYSGISISMVFCEDLRRDIGWIYRFASLAAVKARRILEKWLSELMFAPDNPFLAELPAE